MARPQDGADTLDGRHICCTLTSVILRIIRGAGGDAAVRTLLAESGCEHDEGHLTDLGNWVSKDEAIALLAAGTRLSGDPSFAHRVGEMAVRQHAGTHVATLLRSLGSPEAVLRGITMTAAKFSTITDMEALEVGPGRAVVRSSVHPGFERHELLCRWTTGLLSQPTVLFGLPPAQVEELACAARGDEACVYTITWDAAFAAAAADPEQRLLAVEAQLAAMSDRMEGAFAAASDLVSPDALDTVLERILDRAAYAVRAPGYVLAVRGDGERGPRVFSHGLPAAQASDLASAALDGGADLSDSALVAPVASSRHDYGRLLALFPSGHGFFPQERQLLSVYAKHAAAVLDMATALEYAANKHEQSSALLALSHSLARAGTGVEVAARLAEAVPRVVDCDRMGVWLWDQATGTLNSVSNVGLDQDERAMLGRMEITAGDTPNLAQAMADREPMFFDADTDDPFMRALIERLGLVALIVVPIVARDEFLGVLNVGVVERPDRLRRSTDLIERLTGVAALAAPAIQNGRLVDELHHEATHDSLTGLLNRAGFARCIDASIGEESPSGERIGLLFVDLDGFKRVNDVQGHEAGDEVLRQAAERFSRSLRGSDRVARLGGDEFAAILTEVRTDEEVHAAARRVCAAFEEPFDVGSAVVSVTASVGEAIWPDDGRGVEALIRHADAEMYRRKGERPVR